MYQSFVNDQTDRTVHAWVRLVRAYIVAMAEIENALKEAQYPPLSWYDVLLELDRAGDKGLRPIQLERELLLPQYGVSRLVDRIEKEGFIKSEPCKDDGRGRHLVITSRGRKLRQRMWSVYKRAIEETVGSKLTVTQEKTLSDLLAKVSE